MDSARFETFIDAIIAIMLTVMVLKIPQPATMDFIGIWDLRIMYFSYFVSFIVLFSIWDHHRKLFSIVKEINNRIISLYSVLIFLMTFIPYSTAWVAHNPYDIVPELFFGFLFLTINILYVYISNKVLTQDYVEHNMNNRDFKILLILNITLIILGVLLSFYVNPLSMMILCLVTLITWNTLPYLKNSYNGDNNGN